MLNAVGLVGKIKCVSRRVEVEGGPYALKRIEEKGHMALKRVENVWPKSKV